MDLIGSGERALFSRHVIGGSVLMSGRTRLELVGDPADCEGLEVGFVNGRDSPETFLQGDPHRCTAFTNDQISHGVRFEFGAGIVNYRPFAGYMT
jgi:hypothetical protein